MIAAAFGVEVSAVHESSAGDGYGAVLVVVVVVREMRRAKASAVGGGRAGAGSHGESCVRKGSERLAGTAMAYVVPVSQPACASGLGGFGFCPLGGGLGGGGHSPG